MNRTAAYAAAKPADERLSSASRVHREPTIPFTESISLFGSYPLPSLNTNSTFSTSAIVRLGSPLTTVMSAAFPTLRVPILAPSSRKLAPFSVWMWIASSGVNPATVIIFSTSPRFESGYGLDAQYRALVFVGQQVEQSVWTLPYFADPLPQFAEQRFATQFF